MRPDFRGDSGSGELVHFHERDARGAARSTDLGRIISGDERHHHGGIATGLTLQRKRSDLRERHHKAIGTSPVVVLIQLHGAARRRVWRFIQREHRVGECAGHPQCVQARPDSADQHGFGYISANRESGDQDLAAGVDLTPRRDVGEAGSGVRSGVI